MGKKSERISEGKFKVMMPQDTEGISSANSRAVQSPADSGEEDAQMGLGSSPPQFMSCLSKTVSATVKQLVGEKRKEQKRMQVEVQTLKEENKALTSQS